MDALLEVKALTVTVAGKRILHDVSLSIKEGTVAVLFGPNGCGKTSLLKAIMGGEDYKVDGGAIFFRGEDITPLGIDQRARLGIGMAFQRPPAVRGGKLRDILRIAQKGQVAAEDQLSALASRLNLAEFLDRDVNLGFSGGEIKRSELLQLLAQAPSLVMLDEPDSGVDLVNMKVVGEAINGLLEKEKPPSQRSNSGLIVTHSGYILDYVNADLAYVMLDGTIYCSGNPRDLLDDIRSKGYEGCVQCRG